MLRIGVLVSGGGTSLRAILDARKSGVIHHMEMVHVFSSNVAAYALRRAMAAGITNECIFPAGFPDREAFRRALFEVMECEKPDFIVLVGYLVKILGGMIRRYRGKILNIHPSLIPSFCGKGAYSLKVHEQALRHGVKVTGATVHLVDEGLDERPILLRKAIEVKLGDTPETLQRCVMEEAEWTLLPRATEKMAREVDEGGDGV